MKTYMKPTMEVTELSPEESLAACRTRTRFILASLGCRRYKFTVSNLSS